MFPPLGGKQNQELVGLVCVFMLKREANISKNLCLFFFFLSQVRRVFAKGL